jgi:hypothetical protein
MSFFSEGEDIMEISTFRARIKPWLSADDGAVTVDWVVLTALVVTLLSAGYGSMRDGTIGLADNTSSFLATYMD